MRYFDIHTHRECLAAESGVWRLHSLSLPQAEETVRTGVGNLCFSAGLHPWLKTSLQNLDTEIAQLENLIQQTSALWAVGECGLDRLCDQPLAEQIVVFKAQITLSEQYKKPLIVHCVRTYADLLQIRRETKATQPWIVHGYRGNIETARQLQKQGLYLSFGRYFYTNIFTSIDMRYILLETDDEPGLSISQVYNRVAEASHIAPNYLCRQIEENITVIFPRLSTR